MKAAILALAMTMATPVAAAVTYDFTAYGFNGQSLGGFSYTTDNFIQAGSPNNPTVVASSQLTCTLVGGCGDASFIHDSGTLFGGSRDVLAFGGPAIAAIYFFSDGSFTTPGAYIPINPDIPTPTGRLVVSQGVAPVPEPGEWALLGLGLIVAGAAARRRRTD